MKTLIIAIALIIPSICGAVCYNYGDYNSYNACLRSEQQQENQNLRDQNRKLQDELRNDGLISYGTNIQINPGYDRYISR